MRIGEHIYAGIRQYDHALIITEQYKDTISTIILNTQEAAALIGFYKVSFIENQKDFGENRK